MKGIEQLMANPHIWRGPKDRETILPERLVSVLHVHIG